MSDHANIFNADRSDAFTALCLDYLDGRLDDIEAGELKRQLKADPAKRQAFVLLMYRTQLLAEAHGKPRSAAKPRTRTPGIAASKPIPLIIYPIAIAAALLFTAAIVGVYLVAFTTDPQPDPIKPNEPGPSVATLIEVSGGGDLRTPHGYPAEGDDFSAGEYTLSGGGTAEFMLTNAVNVKLSGETRMVMRNDMNVALTRGRADFVCPKDAKGFTVALPHGMKVVDLGTAFTVRIDDHGAATVTVTDGEVDLVTADGAAQRMVVGDYALADSQGMIRPEASWIASSGNTRPTTSALIDYKPGIDSERRADNAFTVGSLIEVGDAPITLTHLGVQDVPARGSDVPDGFIGPDPIRVGLWDESGQTLLAEVAVSSDAMLRGTYRYAPIAGGPVVLNANTRYLIGAHVGAGIEPFLDHQHETQPTAGYSFAASSAIRVIEGRYADHVFAAPTRPDRLDPRRWAPANALFIDASVPEQTPETKSEESADADWPKNERESQAPFKETTHEEK